MSWVHQYLTKIMIRSVISFQWGKRVLLICLYKLATTFFNLSTWRRRIDRWVHGEGHLTKSEGFNDGKKASSKTVLTGSLKMRPHLSHILRESSGDEIKILQDTCLSNLDTTSKRHGYVQLCQLVSIVEVSFKFGSMVSQLIQPRDNPTRWYGYNNFHNWVLSS